MPPMTNDTALSKRTILSKQTVQFGSSALRGKNVICHIAGAMCMWGTSLGRARE